MQFLTPMVCAAALSASACYPLMRWSGKLRLQAQPRPDRWHTSATPNTGGVGIVLASALCFLAFAEAESTRLAICAAWIALVGFVDDRLELRPLAKLIGQALPAAYLVTSGLMFSVTPWPVVNTGLSVAWLIGVTNAFNLIDNMDGLCGGVATIAAIAGIVLTLLKGDGERAILLAVIAGACAGFLFFNHKPARIFLGDCGSLFLGFTLAALAIDPVPASTRWIEGASALMAFLYPLFDSVLVSLLRRRAGRPISVGGRDHSSHRLVAAGMTERSAVWSLWAVAAACATFGPLTYMHPRWFLPALAGFVALFAVFGSYLARLPVSMPGATIARSHRKFHVALAGQREAATVQTAQKDPQVRALS